MKFICNECGNIFDEDEVCKMQDYRGEYWGTPAYEEISVCPYCHGDFEEYHEEEGEEDDG